MFGAGSSVGLYLDGKRIYAAELRTQFGESQIVRTVESDVLLTAANPTPDEGTVSHSLSELFQKEGIRHKEVFIALTEKESIVRYFEMPLLPRRERADSVRFEAQKYLPFDIRELYYDCAIQVDGSQKKMRVTFLAAKKEAVHRIVSIVNNAGLKVISLESASMATTRALYPADTKNAGEAFAILDIDKKGFIHILIVKNDMLLMARDHLYFKAAGVEGISAPDFKSCVSEIRLSLNYFSKNFKNENLSKVILCADLKNTFKGWDAQMEAELGIPVRAGNPLGSFTVDQVYSSGMTTAIGLGMRGCSHARGVNLSLALKGKFAADKPDAENPAVSPETAGVSEQEESFLKKIAFTEIAAVALIGAAAYFLFLGRLSAATADLAEVNRAVPAEYALPLDQLTVKEADLNKKIALLSRLVEKRIYLTTKLNEVAKTVPADVRLTALDYRDSEGKDGGSIISLKIEGAIPSVPAGVDLDAVNHLVAAFTADKEFMTGLDEVKLVSAQNMAAKEFSLTRFIINCSTKEKTQTS